MGSVFSIFKSKSFEERLDNLQIEIERLQNDSSSSAQFSSRVSRHLLTVFAVFAGLGSTYAYSITQSSKWIRFLNICTVSTLTMALYYITHKLFGYYYSGKSTRSQRRLLYLLRLREAVLESVKETQTFNVAQRIFARHAPHLLAPRSVNSLQISNNFVKRELKDFTLNERHTANNVVHTRMSPETPVTLSITSHLSPPNLPNRTSQDTQLAAAVGNGHMPARAVCHRDRSVVGRVLDYFLDDGPTNRYALICSSCHEHNGLALKEEFEYLAFRCCYCRAWNPARKQRPCAPRLPLIPSTSPNHQSSSEDSSDDSSQSESRYSALYQSKPEKHNNHFADNYETDDHQVTEIDDQVINKTNIICEANVQNQVVSSCETDDIYQITEVSETDDCNQLIETYETDDCNLLISKFANDDHKEVAKTEETDDSNRVTMASEPDYQNQVTDHHQDTDCCGVDAVNQTIKRCEIDDHQDPISCQTDDVNWIRVDSEADY